MSYVAEASNTLLSVHLATFNIFQLPHRKFVHLLKLIDSVLLTDGNAKFEVLFENCTHLNSLLVNLVYFRLVRLDGVVHLLFSRHSALLQINGTDHIKTKVSVSLHTQCFLSVIIWQDSIWKIQRSVTVKKRYFPRFCFFIDIYMHHYFSTKRLSSTINACTRTTISKFFIAI